MLEVIIILTGAGVTTSVYLAASMILARLRDIEREHRHTNTAIMDYLEQKRNEPLLLHDPQKRWSLTVLGKEIVREEKYDAE